MYKMTQIVKGGTWEDGEWKTLQTSAEYKFANGADLMEFIGCLAAYAAGRITIEIERVEDKEA